MHAVLDWLTTGFLPFVVLLGTLVLAHEFGHFVVAKWSGMRVREFAIGFGPPIFRVVRGETGYSIRAVPLGGFVQIAGMDPNEDPNVPGGFNTKPIWARFLTLLSGCLMNLLLAVFVFCIVGMVFGVPRPITRVAQVFSGSPAAASGLKVGDRILSVDGEPVDSVLEVRRIVERSAGRPLRMTLDRGGRTLSVTVVPRQISSERVGRIGIVFDTEMVQIGPVGALRDGLVSTLAWTHQIALGVVQLVTGRVPASEVGGPVAIARATAVQADQGLDHFLRFGGIISVNLAVVNLIPFPGLDGARLAFLLIELVRGKRFDPKKEAYVHAVGIAILFLLLIAITGKDLTEWIQDLSSR